MTFSEIYLYEDQTFYYNINLDLAEFVYLYESLKTNMVYLK